MSPLRAFFLTTLAMIAFAGNSLLCRAALRDTDIDAATFTTVRLVSGALTLWLLVAARRLGPVSAGGSWLSGLALFVYAGAFSFAYLGLTTAMGALLLFGAVQITMISVGHWRGDRMQPLQWLGFAAAFGGLVGLLLPGLSAPPLLNSVLMISAGIAWGVYSLRGRGAGEPTLATAGNFVRSVPFTLVLSVLSLSMLGQFRLDTAGVGYGVASGAITSALGYAIWYMALPALKAATAATVQLTVPLIAAVGGILLLSEPLTLRLVLAGLAILGGVWLVIQQKQRQPLPLR